MKNYYSNFMIAIFLMTSHLMYAQNYAIGHKTITYNDPTRSGGYGSGGGNGRQIQCEIYYPSISIGNDVPIVSGEFPIIVFGHGFFISWDAYANIWEHYVSSGAILVFPRTEGSFSPNHLDFGKDLIIAGEKIKADCNNSSNFFYNSWNDRIAVMGHSMGGGASFLSASDQNTPFDVLIGLAPAETTPSAISASKLISIPSIILSGSEDAVTPPSQHHQLMFDSLSPTICKQFVSIIGGAHCYFSNSNTACDFGESTSGGNISIDRATQQDIMFDILDPWLEFYLKGDCIKYDFFLSELSSDIRIIGTNECNYQTPQIPVIIQNNSILSITSVLTIQWFLDGQQLLNEMNDTLNMQIYGYGDYEVEVTDSLGCSKLSSVFTFENVSIGEIDLNILEISPNPFSDDINIYTNGEMVDVQIYDSYGRSIQKIEKSNGKIDGSNLKPGYYLLKIGDKQTFKIIKI